MKRKSSLLVLLAALLLGCGMARGQNSPGAKLKKARTSDDYKSRTLKEIAAHEPNGESREDKNETVIVTSDILASRVRATYAGFARPLPQNKKRVIQRWAQLYAGSPESYTEPYETELLFNEDGRDYWLGVKKQSLARFKRSLKQGEAMDLYLIRVGASKASGRWELMLLIENVQMLK